MYEARKICNWIIARYSADRFELTNLRLNKLLYFVHGWSLRHKPDGLIRNHFEAWQLGPVIRPVYDTFKVFGESKITEPAKFLDYSTGEMNVVSYNDISSADAAIIAKVVESYAGVSTSRLVAISHEKGGPWDVTFRAYSADNRLSPRIPNELIRLHFLAESGGQTQH